MSVVKLWCWLFLCVDAGELHIHLQNEHFYGFCTKIGYKTYFNVMITTFKNICVLKSYVILLRTILNTTHQGRKQVKIYMWALHHKLVLFQKGRNCFCYAPEKEIKGGSMGWTTLATIIYKTPMRSANYFYS